MAEKKRKKKKKKRKKSSRDKEHGRVGRDEYKFQRVWLSLLLSTQTGECPRRRESDIALKLWPGYVSRDDRQQEYNPVKCIRFEYMNIGRNRFGLVESRWIGSVMLLKYKLLETTSLAWTVITYLIYSIRSSFYLCSRWGNSSRLNCVYLINSNGTSTLFFSHFHHVLSLQMSFFLYNIVFTKNIEYVCTYSRI